MKTVIFLLVTFSQIAPLMAAPILIEAGDLQASIDAIAIPPANNADYQLPNDAQRNAFRAAVRHILDGDLQAAADAAVAANYDVVEYTDNVSGDVYALLREKNTNQHWGGFYAFDLTPERALVVECPHPLYDGVRVPAADIFMQTNACAFLMSGTHRNNSLIESLCDGDLGGDPYRISDMAHQPDGLFQAAHEEIEDHHTRTVSLNFHGMADASDPADVVISNGTPSVFVGNSLSRALAARMNEILVAGLDPRVAVSHQEPGQNPGLSGSNNTQGRYTNGSEDLCMADAPRALFPERFIHMECDPDVRSGPPSNWAFVIQALNDRIPLFADPVPETRTGDITITELMADPSQAGDSTGEYLELFNYTGQPITMTNWTIADRGGNTATFSGVIQPGNLFVVGVSGDLTGSGHPDGIPDAVWTDAVGDLTLTNSGDVIYIIDDHGDLVSSVAYDNGAAFGTGVSHEIIKGNGHVSGQTLDAEYIASNTTFVSDLGSPKKAGASLFDVALPKASGIMILGATFRLHYSSEPGVRMILLESDDLELWDANAQHNPFYASGGDEFLDIDVAGAKKYYVLECIYEAGEE